MKIVSTGDVALVLLDQVAAGLPEDLRGEVDARQTFLKSAEPPSWVAFLAELPWWLQALGAYAAFFGAEVTKEAAKDTWRNRQRIAAAAAKLPRLVAAPFVQALERLRNIVPPRTAIELGLPYPDDYFGTRLRIEGTTAAEFAADLALFLYHLPALADLLKTEDLSPQTVSGQIRLKLKEDGDLEVSWLDRTSLQSVTRTLRLPDAV